MHSLDLVIARTPAQEKALDQLLADQQDPKSAQYQRWLTPAEFGRRFGASDAAIHTLSEWLKSYGLQAGEVPASRSHLPFSGSKAQVEAAFHTQIHLIDVQGERHYANVSDPLVPAAVQPLIRAVRGLNDFNPKPGVRPSRAAPRAVPDAAPSAAAPAAGSGWALPHPNAYYSGSNQYPGYVGPSDFAVIYNLKPLYQNNITGAGVTIAIAAQSDLNAGVLTSYWTAFGVAGSNFGLPAQSFTSMPVPGGTDPGQTQDGNEDEAYLDTEILGALAPGAQLVLVRDMSATTAAQYVIDQNLAAVLNISFGTCESGEASENATVNSMYQQGVSEGITITVSSADAGVAACTAHADLGTLNDVNSNGFAVNGLASTPYNLAVGGTDFNDLDANTDSMYWSTTNPPGTFETALSHIPEMVWNDSCANPVFAQAYGSGDPIAFCNTATLGTAPNTVANPFILISGGGGGVSSCTTTDNSGNCTGGYAQPSWQANVAGISNFGARAVPDVSMIATRWLVCSYEITTCNPANAPSFPAAPSDTIQVFDGTSASAPSVAAIVAMIDQSQITGSNADGRQGLINTKLYQIAGIEYGSAATLAACSADQGGITGAACVFYDIVSGSNAQPCSISSYAASATGTLPASTCANEGNASYKTGIMEAGGTQDYAASQGFDMTTGLGSINAAGLVSAFQAAAAPTGLRAAAAGTTVTLTWTADTSATHGFDVYQGTASGQESTTPVQQNVTGTTTTVTALPAGLTYYFEIAAVTALGVSPFSNEAKVTLAPAAPTGLAAAAAGAGALTLTWVASPGATSYNLFEGTSAGGETAAQTGISGVTVTLTALTPGQQYFFKLEAVNAGGHSAQSVEASGTVLAAVPMGLAATAGNGSVSLTWSAAAGAKTYDVYDGKSSGGEGATPVMTGLTSPSASVTGLSNGTPYYFTVAAVDAGGTSAQSVEAHATPVAPSGGGGAMDWIGLGALAAIAASSRRTPSSRRRAGPRHCR
jgi:subtilase family serine protease